MAMPAYTAINLTLIPYWLGSCFFFLFTCTARFVTVNAEQPTAAVAAILTRLSQVKIAMAWKQHLSQQSALASRLRWVALVPSTVVYGQSG